MAEHTAGQSIRFPLGPVIAAGVTLLLSISIAFASQKPGTQNFASAADTRIITALSGEDRLLSFYDGGSGRLLASRSLEFTPSVLRPTPGGVSVFVGYEDAPFLDVFSTETFEFQRRNEISTAGVEELVFSPDGSLLYVFHDAENGSHRVQEYQHELLSLRPGLNAATENMDGQAIMGGNGQLIYRWGNSGIQSIFTANLDQIARYQEAVDGLLHDSQAGILWVISQGELQALDPRTLDAVTGRAKESDPSSPSYAGDLVRRENLIFALRADGSGVDVFPGDWNRELLERRGMPDPLESIELPEMAYGMIVGASGLLVAAESGRWYGIGDNASGITPLPVPAHEKHTDLFRTAVIRRDGSFACF